MSSKIKVDTIENVAGSGNVSLGSGHNLVVPGNITGSGTATITGDLTVDTSSLKVNASNNFIGIGTASPQKKVHILDTTSDGVMIFDRNGTSTDHQIVFAHNYQSGGQSGGNYYGIGVDGSENKLVFAYDANSQASLSADAKMIIDASGNITKPNQPMAALQPDTSSNVTISNTNADHVIGWKVVGGRQTLIRGITLGASTHANPIANGNNTGRLTFTSGGVYYFDYTLRMENTPGAGNLYVKFNGNTIHRMHVEGWARSNYRHGRVSRAISVSANDYVEFIVACPSGGQFSGSGDTVNWLTIMKVA